MKKLIIIFTSIAVLLLGGWYIYDINCPYGVYEIEIDSECIRNDSVGNEWYFDYTLEGEPITYGYRIILPLDKITVKTFKATITESDKYPDVSSGSIELLIEDKVTKTMEIAVREHNGRFSGNTAVWKVTAKVNFVKKTMHIDE